MNHHIGQLMGFRSPFRFNFTKLLTTLLGFAFSCDSIRYRDRKLTHMNVKSLCWSQRQLARNSSYDASTGSALGWCTKINIRL